MMKQGMDSSISAYVVMAAIFSIFPIAGSIGYYHYKKTPAYTSEIEVQIESNPYYYKLPPGYWREAIGPLMWLLACDLNNRNPNHRDIQQLMTTWILLCAGEEVGRRDTKT